MSKETRRQRMIIAIQKKYGTEWFTIDQVMALKTFPNSTRMEAIHTLCMFCEIERVHKISYYRLLPEYMIEITISKESEKMQVKNWKKNKIESFVREHFTGVWFRVTDVLVCKGCPNCTKYELCQLLKSFCINDGDKRVKSWKVIE